MSAQLALASSWDPGWEPGNSPLVSLGRSRARFVPGESPGRWDRRFRCTRSSLRSGWFDTNRLNCGLNLFFANYLGCVVCWLFGMAFNYLVIIMQIV